MPWRPSRSWRRQLAALLGCGGLLQATLGACAALSAAVSAPSTDGQCHTQESEHEGSPVAPAVSPAGLDQANESEREISAALLAIKPIDSMGYLHTVVGGTVYPAMVTPACIEEAQRDVVLRHGDIVIATHPRCGTTWMQQIVLLLLFGGNKSRCPRPTQQVPWIESSICFRRFGVPVTSHGKSMSGRELTAWDGEFEDLQAPPRRAFKTHATVELAPWRGGLRGIGGAKIIVVTRNPKDACVSLFHHTRDKHVQFGYTGDFQHFTRTLFLRGLVESGCFWAWHAGWERAAASHPQQVFWVSYEDLKRDFPGTIRKLGAFLQIPVSQELIADTTRASSFGAMKSGLIEINKTLPYFSTHHIRNGAVGSWRDDIRGPLLAEFDAVHEAKTASLGLQYKFDFGDM